MRDLSGIGDVPVDRERVEEPAKFCDKRGGTTYVVCPKATVR
jgi:hypothetical protein